jgi:hypothetical protein
MASPLPYSIHSITDVAAQIYQGEEPWYALGCFLHDWWCHPEDVRQELIAEPPAPATMPEEKRWAAFCAATVEELCARTSCTCPSWCNRPDYFLEQPWFYHPQQSQRDWQLATTPEPFKRRNIFVGGSVLDNKYELRHMFGSKPKWAMWSDQELQNLSRS